MRPKPFSAARASTCQYRPASPGQSFDRLNSCLPRSVQTSAQRSHGVHAQCSCSHRHCEGAATCTVSDRRGLFAHTVAGAAALAVGSSSAAHARQDPGPAVTQKVYLDIGLCGEALRADRKIGDASALCAEPQSIGRLTFGLYGDAAPGTTARFAQLVRDGVYDGTTFHKIRPGAFVKAGRQGQKRLGEVALRGERLAPNNDTVASAPFATEHTQPGTLSWCLAENDDEDRLKVGRNYSATEFLITLGSNKKPDLDGNNIAFGKILDGWDTLTDIAATPIIRPSGVLQNYNKLATVFGDERADGAKRNWFKPLKAIVITGSGVL